MDENEREHHVTRRRALMMELASLDKLLAIEKPVVFVPYTLHPFDEQQLAKYFRIAHELRPAS